MNGRPGSYYANPIVDVPAVSEREKNAHPEYYGNNIWPDPEEKNVEGFEEAFKDLGRFVFRAMYLQEGDDLEPTIVPSPSLASGLYIRTRGGDLTKVSIPPDCLAFQTGEALEIATGGKLRATPHCVRAGGKLSAQKISRETFALFLQPNTDQYLSTSETFGQFSKKIFQEHYKAST
ncbi:hypothetical protein C0992_007617 [Termitomyces sp. T32_za158]|nr:hypothetical protein C0992_007617 [Termitomyces sp. T32_za158]